MGSPPDARELARRLERERGWLQRFAARRGDRHYFVSAGDVDWIEADGNYLRLHSAGRVHMVRRTMKEVEGRLDPSRFVRIHRSTIVAIDRVASIRAREHGDWLVTMVDGPSLPSSRRYAARVRAMLR